MSYILEALKKVEQKREQEDVSKTPTFLSEQSRERKKPRVWPYILAAALFVNAGLALRLFGPWWARDKEPSSTASSPVELKGATTALKEAQSRPSAANMAMKEPARTREAKISPTLDGRQKGGTAPQKPAAGQREASAAPSPPTAQKVLAMPPDLPKDLQVRVEKAPPAAFAGKVVSLSELPASIRSSLPEFRVSGHAYGPDPQTRVVRVNEKILQEGQELSPGLKVEEITPDGVILLYSGYHFRIGLK